MSDPIQDIIDKAGLGFRDYIVCALWSSVYCGPKEGPDAPEYMDDEVGIYDFDPETLRKLADEYRRFLTDCTDEIGYGCARAAHDFWLTRNHHGAGFWDTGRWPEEDGKKMTEYAHKAGEVTLYVGDDGKVYA